MAIAARNPCVVSSISSRTIGSKPSSKRSSDLSSSSSWSPKNRGGKTNLRFVVALASGGDSSSSSSSSSSGNSVAQGVRINGGSSENALCSWWQEAFAKLEADFRGETSLLQLLHEGARVFQMSMERNESLSRGSWLVNKWTGFDSKAWMKLLSYQVSVYGLLQAVKEIAMRGEGRDRDVHVFVQRSLSRQCDPLDDSIKKLLASRDPAAAEWLSSQQVPFLVTSFVNILEKDPEFAAVTSTNSAASPSKTSDIALLKLSISSCGAAMKLGPATLACVPFSNTLMDEIGRLMNMLAEIVPIREVYNFSCNLGLRQEFLKHFGLRAANGELGAEERAFWVDLSEHLLRNSLVRECVLNKLKPYDTVESLERDLAVFGFFAALGRRARSFLSAEVDPSRLDESLASLLRYLEGGCVLFYPQLSTLTYYQLFVEIVREEMEWLPTLPKSSLVEGAKRDPKNPEYNLAVYTVLNVCSRWVADFLRYNTWVQEPGGSRVVDFLLKCQSRLLHCREELKINWESIRECMVEADRALSLSQGDGPSLVATQKQLKLFDENMEDAICRLESLLEKSSGGSSDKLVAVRKDLERIRRLKKEAEALEASIKAKANFEGCLESADMETQLSVTTKTYNDVFNKSIEKLKDASADLWRGTQLLGTDVAEATILLRNGALGQQLTERERKTLMRTFTDLASVIPIGFLMLLPVTAVGHAAMLAAIQKYIPALIPSAYGPERLDLLRQLEKVKQLEAQSEKRNPDDHDD